MEKILDARTAATLALKYMRPGACSNNFLNARQYERFVHEGSLSVCAADGALVYLRECGGFFRMYYTVSEPNAFPQLPTGDIVAEHVFRSGSEPYTPDFLTRAGLRAAFSRTRLCAEPSGFIMPEGVSVALPGDRSEISALLDKCFDRMTACLSSDEELSAAIEGQDLLAYREGGKLLGIIHTSRTKVRHEIRHLAVAPCARGRGISERLLEACFASRPGRYSVWVRDGNMPAINAYRRFGFAPDGYTSLVFIKSEKEQTK